MFRLNKRGVWINAKDLSDEALDEITTKMTIKTFLIGDKYIISRQHERCQIKDKVYIVVPRFAIFEFLGSPAFSKFKISTDIAAGEVPKQPFAWRGALKNNQPLALAELLRIYEKRRPLGLAGAILNLDAGQGKTFVAMALIDKLQLKTLVVCHNETILYDWTKELRRLFPEARVGQYYGKKKESSAECDILIGIVNSLIAVGKSQPAFFKPFGLVVYDEVHMYCSKGLSRVFKHAQATYMLGLSATPNERGDKFDRVAWWHVGPVINVAELPGYSVADIPFAGHVRRVGYSGPSEFTQHLINSKTGLTDVSKMLSAVAADPHRLKCVCDEIRRLLQSHKNIFVFADRISYLTAIQENLAGTPADQPPMSIISLLTGGASADDIKSAEERADVILTTYQYMSVGKSIPKMNAMVLATPRKSHSRQICNRIFRLGSDYGITRIIIDVVDEKTIFNKQWKHRLRYYKEKAYPIEHIDVDYTNYS